MTKESQKKKKEKEAIIKLEKYLNDTKTNNDKVPAGGDKKPR